ncbi:hypothetical protein Gotri_015836 [Gossypium trilobum]|uniref:Glutaredoxin domain-containing protein n=1 Tax=Gossypium trilobum TaxID=34281 RepID=A0A7J9E250_9ROSI|nr:hypothetical protein [Gossypium trilobum]
MALQKAKDIVSTNPVVVFSKSYCPFCVDVKQLLQQLGASFKAIELDKENPIRLLGMVGFIVCGSIGLRRRFGQHKCMVLGDGSDIQAALAEWTGQRTVPNVFIGGKHIGGCDSTMALHKEGKLVPLLTEAGAITKSSV